MINFTKIAEFFFQYVIPTVTLLVVCKDTVRSWFLTATYDGKKFVVPNDEVKERFRRAALAEASRLAGGKRVDLEVAWEGNNLKCTTIPPKSAPAPAK